MDHSKMDHSHMGHGGSGVEAEAMVCRMSMLFNWHTDGLCIIFRQWHISGTPSLIFSLLAIVAICAGYEALREASRRYEASVNRIVETVPNDAESTPFLWSGRNQVEISKRAHVVKAVLYALQNFYAFMIMLLFMTYNGFVMIAVAVGAFVGYLAFGRSTSATKDSACH